jgi:hypothetical protein
MKQNKTLYISIAVVVVVIVASVFFSMRNTAKAPTENETADTTSTATKDTETIKTENGYKKTTWEDMLPTVKGLLSLQFENADIEKKHPVKIVAKGDVTGDGTMEAIVSLGNGGVNSDMQTLVMIDKGTIQTAQFILSDGTKSTQVFFPTIDNTTGGVVFRLDPARKLVYAGSFMNSTATTQYSCHVDAYVWNPKSSTFDWNKDTSATVEAEYCKTAGK